MWPDVGGVDDYVPDGDVPDGRHLLLGEDPVPPVLEPESVAVANPLELVADNIPEKVTDITYT